jgi:hypothetical protein
MGIPEDAADNKKCQQPSLLRILPPNPMGYTVTRMTDLECSSVKNLEVRQGAEYKEMTATKQEEAKCLTPGT